MCIRDRLSGPQMLLNRNLLYTAVTRARKCVTDVGNEETFVEMIRNEKQQKRYSALDERIRELSAVSYTHLDVYKRQGQSWMLLPENMISAWQHLLRSIRRRYRTF